MLKEKKQRIATIFMYFFAIYVGIIVFLLFFNLGLNISQAEFTGDEFKVNVENTGINMINNVSVFYVDSRGTEVKVKDILLLEPNAKQEVVLQDDWAVENQIQLIVKAPYYQPLIKHIGIKKKNSYNLRPGIRAPSYFVINEPTQVGFNLCNRGSAIPKVILKLIYSSDYLDYNGDSSYEFELENMGCTEIPFEFIPKKEGLTMITFKVEIEDFFEVYEKEIKIEE